MLSEFFRDLDVVPSDVIVGLVLLRKRQQLLRIRTIHQVHFETYFLSTIFLFFFFTYVETKNCLLHVLFFA